MPPDSLCIKVLILRSAGGQFQQLADSGASRAPHTRGHYPSMVRRPRAFIAGPQLPLLRRSLAVQNLPHPPRQNDERERLLEVVDPFV